MKTAAIIQARMGSSRLPGKILLPLPYPNGPFLLQHIVERAKKASHIDKVIIATSQHEENEVITEELFNTEVFRGDEENVLDRFVQITQKYGIDTVVRLTGDNPFVDVHFLEKTIAAHQEANADYTKTIGLPLGMNFEIISGRAALEAGKKATLASEKEHVTPYIRNAKHLTNQEIHIYDKCKAKNWRLTIDYETDYALCALIFAACYQQDKYFGMQEIYELLDNSWLAKINRQNFQKIGNVSEGEELKQARELLLKLGLRKAANVINTHII